MRLDSISPAGLPQTQLTTTPVGPTLLVGLGGTGKEVLLRLRRMVVERYGSLDDLSFLRFMHLDTDKNDTAGEQYDLRRADDPLYPQIKFSNVERIDLSIFGGTGRYVDHLGNYPNVKRWFPSGAKIAALGDLHEGAGQVRMASRLGFFDASNHQKIASRLEQCRRELSDASIMQQASNFGFTFEPKRLRVVIVASLAGGTGSGTFLDTGFLVKRYFKEAERLGILLLPSFFAEYAGSDRVRANGYAALMELNHYTFGHSFIADWTPHEADRMGPPPFTNTYLIDGRNEEGLTINSGGGEYDAYRMVAEVLFQDYSIGAFAGMKRATRVNLEQYNLKVYTHNFLNDALGRASDSDTHKTIVGDPFPCRFGSFGLSTISFPTERVQNACASRLATKVLDFWKKTAVEDPLEHLFTKFLADEKVLCAQGQYERRDGGGVIDRNDIEDALMVHDAGSGRTFGSFLWQKAQALRVELEATPNGEKAACLRARRAELDQFFAHEDSEDPEEWGIGIRQLENNMRRFLQSVKEAIEAKAAELSDNPQYGVNYTLSLLQGFKALLRNENFRYMPWFDSQIPQWRDRVQYYTNALDQLLLDVGRHESEFLFRAADLHRDYEKLVGDDGDEDRGAFFNHFEARVGKQIAKRGREICDQLDAFLGPDHAGADGLLGRYYELIGGFDLVRQQLQKKETYFAKPEKSELIISLYKEGDLDEWYHTWIGADATTETQTVRTVGSSILTDVFQVDRVTAALEKIQRTPAETIERMIFAKCRAYIVSQKKQPEALGILLSLGEHERAEKVAQAYRLSKVWLAPSEQGLEHIGLQPVDAKQRPLLIGLDDRTHPQRVQQFKDLVGKAKTSGDSSPQFLGLGEQHRGMIVFYHELAGVPAFYPSSVTAPLGLRAAYNGFAEKEELHTDKNRFQFGDLIPKQPAEGRQYAQSVRAFVLARVLGLLDVHSLPADAGQLAFRFSYKRMIDLHMEEVNLGGEAHAIDFLYRDRRNEHESHRRYLIQEIEKRIRLLRDNTKLVLYRLLLDFYMNHVYPPREVTDAIPDMTLTQYSPEYAVLDDASKQLDQLVGPERDRFMQQYEKLTNRSITEQLTYREYAAILAPLCKSAGKYAARKEDAVVDQSAEWREIFALDAMKFEKKPVREVVAPRPAAPPIEAPKKYGERPCAVCAKPVDQRANHCTQCNTNFAEMVPCPHCSEPRVPSDLANCWKCGQKMRLGDLIECAQCFTWSGYEDDYPCPNCGYDLDAATPAIAAVDSPRIPIHEPVRPAPERTAAAAEPTVTAVLTVVQCAICDSEVTAGATCSVCNNPLEAR
jgi:hypothetical protein